MPLQKIYVVRHGFRSSWSVDPKTGVYMGIPSPTGIHGDPALTSYGIDQAKELGSHLETLDPPVEKVYSSPFYRCLQTMVPFMELQRDKEQRPAPPPVVTKMLPEHGIREWFGSAPFDHPEPAAPGVLKTMFPAYDESYSSTVRPSPKGETLDELQERITKALRGIIHQCDADGTRAIVLCSHAAVIILMGRILTGLVPDSVDVDDFHAYTCGLSVYCRSSGAAAEGNNISDNRDGRHSPPALSKSDASLKTNLIGGWECQLNSDCTFLSGGAERGWKFTGDESFPDTGSLSQSEPASKL